MIRRIIAIRLLRQGIDPKQIVEDVFKMDERNSVRDLEACFDNMEFNEIMSKYYKRF